MSEPMSMSKYSLRFLRLVQLVEEQSQARRQYESYGRKWQDWESTQRELWAWHLEQVAAARKTAIRECDLEAAYREGFKDGGASESAFRRKYKYLTASGAWARSETANRLAALLPPEEAP